MSVCLVLSAIFCKLINEVSWGATRLGQILFQIGRIFYGDFSGVATGLWRGLFEPYAMSRVVPAFQIGQNVHRRRPQTCTNFHVNGRRSRWENACCGSSKSSLNCPWSCRRSKNLPSSVPPDFDRKSEDASCYRKICAASADASLLIHEFLTKHETTVVPPTSLLSRCDPCRLFLVPEVEILTKRSPIWDGRRDRRKFDTGLSCCPAKHVPVRVPEMEETFGVVYQEWRGVLWRWQVWLSCK